MAVTYEDALKKYPDWAWVFNIPGVGDELRHGVEDPAYDPIPKILQSEWYRTTQASVRQWDALKQTDPASAQARLREAASQVWDKALQLGLPADASFTSGVAEQMLRMGWQDSQLNDYLVAHLSPTNTSGVGGVQSTIAQLKQQAAQYFVPLSDDTAFGIAKSIMSGEHVASDWVGVWRDQAKQQFPTIAGVIDGGITPEQYFAPIRERIAAQLERSPNTINMMEPRWSQVIDHDDGSGNRRIMTFNEVDKLTRSQAEYAQTRGAKEAAATLGQTLTTMFGEVAS